MEDRDVLQQSLYNLSHLYIHSHTNLHTQITFTRAVGVPFTRSSPLVGNHGDARDGPRRRAVRIPDLQARPCLHGARRATAGAAREPRTHSTAPPAAAALAGAPRTPWCLRCTRCCWARGTPSSASATTRRSRVGGLMGGARFWVAGEPNAYQAPHALVRKGSRVHARAPARRRPPLRPRPPPEGAGARPRPPAGAKADAPEVSDAGWNAEEDRYTLLYRRAAVHAVESKGGMADASRDGKGRGVSAGRPCRVALLARRRGQRAGAGPRPPP
jgi:hypothetical protein